MIDRSKKYSKKEFKKLLDTGEPIGYYTTNNDELFDYYVCPDYGMLEEDVDDEAIGVFEIMNISEIANIESEAADRLWFDRSPIGTDYEPDDLTAEVREQILAEQQRILKEYKIDPKKCDDYYHGYWSGILAVCRYLNAGSQVDLDDLRTGDGLLDS